MGWRCLGLADRFSPPRGVRYAWEFVPRFA